MNATSTTAGSGTIRKYKCFISYSHAADDRLAPALQSGLQRFAKPWYRRRAMRVFRDRTGLAVTPELWGSIRKALTDSDYFILMASPQAAQSKWVEQEVDWWLQNRSAGHLLIVWTDGELFWDQTAGDFDWTETTALPRRLEKVFQEEPNYLDLRFAKNSTHVSLRQPKFLEAVAGLSATLQGRSLDEIIGDDIHQHRKTMRWLRFAVAGLVVLTIAAGVAAILARQAWFRADHVAREIENAETERQRQAMSREAAARSLAVFDETHPELAILLAVEAARAYPSAEAESALRRSLFQELTPELTWPGHPHGTYFARFTPDGRRVITGGADKAVRVWEADSGRMVFELRGHTEAVTGASVSPDGKRICTSSQANQNARVWDSANGENLFEIEQEGLSFARFSPDGKRILTGAWERDAVLWDAASGRRLHRLASSYAQARRASQLLGVSFSPDGSRVALVDWRPAVIDVATGKELFELEGHANQVRDIGYSPDGQWLVTAGEDRAARVWTAATGRRVAVLPHDSGVITATFSPDGQWIVTRTADDRVIRIWETGGWKQVSEIDVRPKKLTIFALSPGGNFLATASDEGIAEVFEARTGARVAELIGHAGRIFSISFSPDGRRIVTVSFDSQVNLYPFQLGGTTEQLVELAGKRVPRQLTAEERRIHLLLQK